MTFNSIDFLIFFPIVLIITNLLKNQTQKVFLLVSSLIFYMWWNPNFIFLILSSIIIDYSLALLIKRYNQNQFKKRALLIFSLVANLGLLGYFKYTNFLLGIFNDVNIFNSYKFPYYDIILPVGISFYTFQSLSYTIDVYRNHIEPKKSFIDFALYVSFFPQLVAGPIVRAETFFRDLYTKIILKEEDLQIAFCQILIGFTRKIVFADNLAVVVDATFANYSSLNPLEIWTGAIAFGWQIYFDFAGYTDIAIGVARLFGYKFDANFNFPMTVKSISEHWTKWHISFSTWIRDYIYIPLGGSRGGKLTTHRNLLITWIFGGVWHGAAYHYLSWGLWQAVMLAFHREFTNSKIGNFLKTQGGKGYEIFSRFFTMFCLGFGFVMFRAENMEKTFEMIKRMLWIEPNARAITTFVNYDYALLLIVCFTASAIFSKNNISTIVQSSKKFILFTITNFVLITFFGVTESQSFLYFAF